MKFSNGCWLNREGVKVYSPAQAYEVRKSDNSLTILAPHNKIEHRGATLAGPVLTIELSSPIPEVIRVRAYHFKGQVKKKPEFDIYETGAQVQLNEDESSVSLQSGNLCVKVNKKDWAMDFYNNGNRLTGTGFRNMAYLTVDGEGPYMREQLGLSVGELVYGLGERFTPFVKNGQTVDIWNEDGGTSTEQSYKNIPFYVTNKGYGVFVNHPEKVSFEVSSEKVTKVQFSVPGEYLEYFVINGPTIKQVLENFTTLTGKPALPPAWSFGLWLTTSFTTNYDEETVNEFIDGMAQRDIPLHVFHFDCFWMKEFNWCDFQWDQRVFPDPKNMLKRLKDKGLKICVWINPYIAQESILFDEGMEKGYLLRRPNGDVWQWDLWQPGMGIVDFTNPDACEWYSSKLQSLIDMGVDSFKTDFGERIPTDVVYYDGSDPYKMHNYYTFLYNKVVFDLLKKNFGENEACVFARSATAGCQQFPVHWGGDCTSDYESMAESLRGGLSLLMSGYGYWSHDIGGFESTSTPDVYMRWAAFGLLSSHSRLHGSYSYRVPWLYGDEAVDVVRFFTKLKCSLMPYIFKNACITSKTGVSLMRAMIVEFQDDPACAYLDRQYMLGDSLMVAPVFHEDGHVTYYLPKGKWTHLLSNDVREGGSYYTDTYGYLSLPLYVRQDSVIAIGSNSQKPDYDYSDNLTYHVFELLNEAQTDVYDVNGNVEASIHFKRENQSIFVTSNNQKPFKILLRNVYAIQNADGCEYENNPLGVLISVNPGLSSFTISL